MPGVLLIEGMAQTAGVICICSREHRGQPQLVYFLTIDKAKFRKPVVPGDTVEYHMTKIAQPQTMWWYRGEAKVAGETRRRGRGRRHDAESRRAWLAIDPTARDRAGAVIGDDVEIGPYCVIGPNVAIGDGCRLIATCTSPATPRIGAARRSIRSRRSARRRSRCNTRASRHAWRSAPTATSARA